VHASGRVLIDGKNILGLPQERYRREVLGQLISMIPQRALNSLNPTRRIKDLAADMIQSHEQIADKKSIQERLEARFSRIGLKPREVLNAYPVELPAGTKQRVVIGISTLLNPKIVIADEPTSALDVPTQKSVIRLLFELMDDGIISSMLFIAHELPLLRHVANRIAVMYAGQFVEVGTTEQVIFDGRQPYTNALMGLRHPAHHGPGEARGTGPTRARDQQPEIPVTRQLLADIPDVNRNWLERDSR
jgi:peptide/nickel transport system ATP-binding protein